MLEVDEARAVITTSLSDADLEAVIARQEAWLARRIGPLEGERTEVFVTPDGDEVLYLARQTDDVVVVDEGGAVTDMELRGWGDVVRTAGSWLTTVEVTYTPADDEAVKDGLITLVRLALTESGYAGESWQGYSATSDVAGRLRMRYSAWRNLLRVPVPQSIRLTSVIPVGGNSVHAVQVTAVAS